MAKDDHLTVYAASTFHVVVEGYGSYDKKTKTWEGDDGSRYPYAVFDATSSLVRYNNESRFIGFGCNVWIFAHSLKEAMMSASDMLEEEGIDSIQIGLPTGDILYIGIRSPAPFVWGDSI